MSPVGYLERVFRASEEENRRMLLAQLPPGRGGSLLDLGAGDGEFTSRVAARVGADRTVAVELVDEQAQLARARGIDVVAADLNEELPFDDADFDLVHANQVIEHVHQTDLFLRELRRVLRPGGLACISTNNMASWHNVGSLVLGFQPTPMHVSREVILGNPLDPHYRLPHRDHGQAHLRLFTWRALRELGEHHGLEAKRMWTSGYYPLPPPVARGVVRVDPRHAAFITGLFSPSASPDTHQKPSQYSAAA